MVPSLLWAAVGLLITAGVFVVIPSLWVLPDALGLLDEGSFGRSIGLLLTVLLLLLISFGAACFYLSLKLLEADRVGRILTIVLAASLGFGLLVGDNKGTWEVLAILGCGGVIAILTLADEVTGFFTGPEAEQANVATSVVAAKSIVVALSYVLGATGLAFLPLGELEGRYVVIGMAMIAIAAVTFKFTGQLLPGDENARLVITGLMAANIVAILVFEPDGAASLIVPIALAGSVIGLLWVPEDARQHFDARA